jgi:hypothetical protein
VKVHKLNGVDGYLMKYIDKKQDASLKIITANHAKSMHKYMNTKFKLLNWKANINFNKVSLDNIELQNMQTNVKEYICA